MTKKIISALQGNIFEKPPFWFMRQAGRYLPEYREVRATASNFLELCYSPEKAAAITLQPLQRYDMDAAIIFSDILVLPDALGQKVEFLEGKGPILEPISNEIDLKRLSLDRIDEILSPIFQTISMVSAELDDKKALIGFAGAPWTVAFYMIEGQSSNDGTKIRRWAATKPDSFQRLIDILCDATIHYLSRQILEGVEAIQLFDSWAGLLSETQFRKWVIEPNRRIVEGIKNNYPSIPIIGFPRNAGLMYFDFVDRTGVDAVSIDHTVPVDWAAEVLQPICTVQGNLDNHLLVAGGEVMKYEVEKILATLGKGPFIFNLGHGILPMTPPSHVGDIAELITKWENS